MSSWVQLLLALLAACLRFGAAEGDPLPAALVELVRSNPISSIEDLQLLLLSDSVDEEEEASPANGGHRLPRSLDAQPAQQALCKVRTEVVEVTRAMLDRSNANFLLWPPCVEVQRCSGCCNTKSLQCVPVLTHTRYLQVMKIQYINKRPTYAKAVVSVVDHVECRCQPAPRPPVPKKKSSRRQQSHNKEQHRNQTLSQGQGQGQGKARSKEELHHWDELKQNQRVQLEDLLEQHWSPRGDTFTQPGEGYSLAGEDTSRSGEAILYAPHWAHNSTRLPESKDGTENQENVGRKHEKISDGNRKMDIAGAGFGVEEKNKGVEDGDGLLLNSTEGKVKMEGKQQESPRYIEENQDRDQGTQRQDTQTDSPSWQEDRSKVSKSQTNDFSQPATQNPQAKSSPTEETNQRVGSRFRPTKEPNPEPREQGRQRHNDTPEEERRLQMEEEKLEEERKELLLLHKRLDQEKEILRQQQMKREEEEREREKEKEKERESQHHHPHNKHHHHLQTTTQKTDTASPTTTKPPSAPAGPRPPARPNPPKRRMRKNRKRISKAAMRAMLM
ncbi:golgin subfamily A member 6-like protein 24 [Centroberyx affinis]|uniref:golgin subfamily A member 6-like protein 24 n=1 Tax=Centroberyx affinis TaxID=166261 RepID=UPI003A5BD629